MKLAEQLDRQVLAVGDNNSIDSTIDGEDMSFILSILSSNLYANPVESLIREYTTNAWDAQIENGKDEPVIVTINTDSQGTYWSVRDFGTGLSPDKIKNVYTKFGKSTKRDSNEQHGLFGIGKFSGLSYTDNVHIHTVVDNIKYYYIMYKGQIGIKTDLLHEETTEEQNGTEVRIYLKSYYDKARFIEGCKSQLAYFENVYFNVDGIKNDYKIHVGTTFRCCEIYPKSDMHLTLGEVVYPMPWSDLGIQAIQVPVAVRFKIGELGVTPNRESILIKDETKIQILNKIKEVANEIVNKYNESASNTDDIDLYFKNSNQPKKLDINNKEIKISNIEKFADVMGNSLMFTGFSDINKMRLTQSNILFNYPLGSACSSFINKPSKFYQASGLRVATYKNISEAKAGYSYDGVYTMYTNNNNSTYYAHGNLNDVPVPTLRYIFETSNKSIINIVKTKVKLPQYIYYLNLGVFPKSEWRKRISDYQEFMKKYLISKGIVINDLSKIVPTPEWIAMDKARRKKNFDYHAIRKAESKILIYKGRDNMKYTYDSIGVFDKVEIKIKDLINPKKLVIYDNLQNRDYASNLLFMTKAFKHIQPTLVSGSNIKYLDNLPNYIRMDKFMEGKNRYIGKIATAHIVKDFLMQNTHLISAESFINKLNGNYGKSIHTLIKYAEDNSLSKSHNTNINWDDFLKDIKDVVKKTRYYDYEMLALLSYVRNSAEDLKFVMSLKGYVPATVYATTAFSVNSQYDINDDVIDFAVEYIKFKKKFRLDSKYYEKEYMSKFLPVAPVPAEEDELIDEVASELGREINNELSEAELLESTEVHDNPDLIQDDGEAVEGLLEDGDDDPSFHEEPSDGAFTDACKDFIVGNVMFVDDTQTQGTGEELI